MAIKLQRGHIEDMSPADKDGYVEFRIGEIRVKAHPNVAKTLNMGDEVMVAGEMKNDVLEAFASKNYTNEKDSQIECTPYMIIFAIGGYVGILCGVFGLEAVSGDWIGWLQDTASIIGLIVAVFAIQRVRRVIRANRWIRYSQYTEAAKGTP